jgi:hypothetical protein
MTATESASGASGGWEIWNQGWTIVDYMIQGDGNGQTTVII